MSGEWARGGAVRGWIGTWLAALEGAEQFVLSRPPLEAGCLYYDPIRDRFVQPTAGVEVVAHYGRPGGVLPRAVH